MSVRPAALVEPVAELLAGLEERDVRLGDLHAVAGARVAADARIATLHRKRAKTAQLDAVAARQRPSNLVENRGDDSLDIALVEMRVFRRKLLNELRFRHSEDARWKWVRRIRCLSHPAASRRRAVAPSVGRDTIARP